MQAESSRTGDWNPRRALSAQDLVADRYSLFSYASRDALVEVDSRNIVRYVSPSIRRYGLEPSEYLGKTGLDLVHPDDFGIVIGLRRALFRGKLDTDSAREYRFRTPSGEEIWVQGHPEILYDDDFEPIGFRTLLTDVSDRKRAELAAQQRERAAGVDLAVAQEVESLHHELRTPLHMVAAGASALGTRLEGENARLAAAISEGAATLGQIVQSIIETLTKRPALFEKAAVATPVSEESVPTALTDQKLNILIADDHPINRQMLGVILEDIANVTLVEDGQSALAAMENTAFDLVILDYQMPVMDGLEAAREIRQREVEGARMPIIMLTANGTSENSNACQMAGVDRFLTKPIVAQAILAEVAALRIAPRVD